MKSEKQKKVYFWTKWFVRRGRHKVHRQTKDRLFRFLFEKDREALLQLYNALNGKADCLTISINGIIKSQDMGFGRFDYGIYCWNR